MPGTTLNEIEAKGLLAEAGIRVTPTELAANADAAIAIAQRLGFPVALKISSPEIVHKSDVDGVRLDLSTPGAVRAAYMEIVAAARARVPQARIDGVTVQPMAPAGGVELIVGVSLDPQFGPLIMCGLGGVFVEVLHDVVFRLLPISARDAREMLHELRGLALLRGVRGRPPVSLDAVEAALLGVSRLLDRRAQIRELDINPLLAYADGAVAVDARALIETTLAAPAPAPPALTREQFDRAFHPRVIAVVGDKMMNGFLWLRALRQFPGKLYSVQIDPNEIAAITAMGVHNVRSLAEIPEAVDYVVCAVPRHVAPRVVRECVDKQVGALTLFTSGFTETGDSEGMRLEAEIAAIARAANLLLVGPNCMGIANPRLGVCNFPDQPAGAAAGGVVSFIGQSGTHTISVCMRAPSEGIGISKAVSIGNATVVDAAAYLDYFGADAETEIIAAYIEGVGDGRRFFDVLRRVAARKPVVLWKGGISVAGQRAIFSHTAGLATPGAVWHAMVRQAGAIAADSQDELLDIAQLLHSGKTPAGARAGLVAMTGGPSVVLSDVFTAAGLEVPPLGESSTATLREFFQVVGGSFRNPLDAGSTIVMGFRSDNLAKLLDVLLKDTGIDLIALDLGAGLALDRWKEFPTLADALCAVLSEFAQRSGKPFAVVVEAPHRPLEASQLRDQLRRLGIVTFASAARAAKALHACATHALHMEAMAAPR